MIATALTTALLHGTPTLQEASRYTPLSRSTFCTEFSLLKLVNNAVLNTAAQNAPSGAYLALDFVTVPHSGQHIEGLNYHYASSQKKTCLSHQFLSTAFVKYGVDPCPLEWSFKVSKALETAHYPYLTATQAVQRKIDDYLEVGLQFSGVLLDGECGRKEILAYSREKEVPVLIRAKGNIQVKYEGEQHSLKKLAQQYPPQRCHLYSAMNWRAKRLPVVWREMQFDVVIVWRKVHNQWRVFFLFSTFSTDHSLNDLLKAWKARWGIEVVHRYAKQSLGAGDCRCRCIQGHNNWMYCVIAAFHTVRVLRQQHPDIGWKVAQRRAAHQAFLSHQTDQFSEWASLEAA